MKKYLALTAAVALLASPAFAQSNNSNLETQSDVLEGARQSQQPGGIGAMEEGRSSTLGGGSGSSNLETNSDVIRGAEESSEPGLPGGQPMGATHGGSSTNSGNLGQ
ncbi:hypothetical protein IZ6_02530 [Terrihabitans soli]|uniref:Uncharacterized protein n=1 Tax=Terrihabitans soli TaxID=708113 RepID=A0A6S6QST8_9HYPH|nr:hypothetical protein [Terrihabitans soli]BCJ89518.1 hypothetical protein IZ6_02530 [Terrihabitans soli]